MKGPVRLSLAEMRFLGEWLLDFNASRAYVASGLASLHNLTSAEDIAKAARELLKRDYIKKESQAVMNRALSAVDRTASDIIADVQRVQRKAEGADNYGAALRALELEGKFHKLFVDTVEVKDIENRAAAMAAAKARASGRADD